jgi:gliding motility-associated-like protein
MSTCVTGLDNGSVVSPTSAYVSVEPNGVNVQSTLPTVGVPPGYTLVVTRSDGANGAFNPLGTSDDRSYFDPTAQTGTQSYCYQTAIRNACGVLSRPTSPACTVFLSRASNGSLTWTSASPYANEPPQSYQLIFIDPATGASDKIPLGNVTSFTPDPDSQITQYQIAAINNAGIESYSNPLEVELGLKVFLPNAFTPNGDGQNQSFMAVGGVAFWNTFDLTIYSRWGDVVYNTTDKSSTGWNGESKGAPAPSGYYGYRIRVTDMSGKAYERTGQVLLIR